MQDRKMTKVGFTNLDKILYPKVKITKAKVIEYYIRMAPNMLHMLAERPAILTRYPNGVDQEGFYEKDAPAGMPDWVETFRRYSETAKRNINYIVCKDLDTLIWLANLAALEIHITLSTVKSFEIPDLALFDIDPDPPATFDDVVEVALLLKEKLDMLGLRSYVKTTGKKGLHVVIPIVPEHRFEYSREFAHQMGKYLSKECELVVSEMSKTKEPGKVFIDYPQNSHGRTMICPYSLRATPNATVSLPLEWKQIKKGLKPDEFTLSKVSRIKQNPWEDMLKQKQKLIKG
jgi:bifunctional non-homologous end joining protein LigD